MSELSKLMVLLYLMHQSQYFECEIPSRHVTHDRFYQEFSTQWDIKATPTFFFLKDGDQFDKLVGANKPDLLKKKNGIVDSESGRHM